MARISNRVRIVRPTVRKGVELDEGDKLAVATLAAARCRALGRYAPEDYINEYADMEARFREFRMGGQQQRRPQEPMIEGWGRYQRAR